MLRLHLEPAATGLPDAGNETLIRNREARRKSLEVLLAKTKDDTARAALVTHRAAPDRGAVVEPRRRHVQGPPHRPPRHQLALLFDGWNIGVMGNPTVNTVGADETQPWPLKFWMGGWDGDALTGYVKGTWEIPLK